MFFSFLDFFVLLYNVLKSSKLSLFCERLGVQFLLLFLLLMLLLLNTSYLNK